VFGLSRLVAALHCRRTSDASLPDRGGATVPARAARAQSAQRNSEPGSPGAPNASCSSVAAACPPPLRTTSPLPPLCTQPTLQTTRHAGSAAGLRRACGHRASSPRHSDRSPASTARRYSTGTHRPACTQNGTD
jgi:hypothetical protein